MKGCVLSVVLAVLLVASCHGANKVDPFKKGMIYAHNALRENRDKTSPLNWSEKLADEATEVATGMTKTKVLCLQSVPHPYKFGDNARFITNLEPHTVVFGWYKSGSLTNTARQLVYNDENKSQVKILWRKTTKFGCGHKAGEDFMGNKGYYVVCRYDREGDDKTYSEAIALNIGGVLNRDFPATAADLEEKAA